MEGKVEGNRREGGAGERRGGGVPGGNGAINPV